MLRRTNISYLLLYFLLVLIYSCSPETSNTDLILEDKAQRTELIITPPDSIPGCLECSESWIDENWEHLNDNMIENPKAMYSDLSCEIRKLSEEEYNYMGSINFRARNGRNKMFKDSVSIQIVKDTVFAEEIIDSYGHEFVMQLYYTLSDSGLTICTRDLSGGCSCNGFFALTTKLVLNEEIRNLKIHYSGILKDR